MKLSLFDYNLPSELIAQKPMRPRDKSGLFVLDRKTGKTEHKHFYNLPGFLRKGDVLIMNETKVFKARLHGTVLGKKVEIFLVRPEGGEWVALGKPGKKFLPGTEVSFGKVKARVLQKGQDGTFRIKFKIGHAAIMALANKIGEIPIPPYIKTVPKKLGDYQTVYAREAGSVAAPTAGLHFTPVLIKKIKKMGVKMVPIVLHVGLGTFAPVRTPDLSKHKMYAEWVEISKTAADEINLAKKEKRRVVVVGTTTVRALEGVAAKFKHLKPYKGDINLFIKPGFKFKVADALITNFHLPKSTLLVLVSAFAGRKNILDAYNEAVAMRYRFFSFGDAMFISAGLAIAGRELKIKD